ncbi:MAG: hypothetical protein AVDCRST_MAG33-2267 [uncultured Thermomicrobiales bacterium]|uniref:Uncharacterized protein n=1 Tax=uncultured Thermomicrobiales bacterium TaxID=1645740 RepID=A0A6J4V6L5_9BACT|nr:MAG: hypothetical protein AVDCRST_MAG33-2267 [uncultured Thermomicrobiales bacterium]
MAGSVGITAWTMGVEGDRRPATSLVMLRSSRSRRGGSLPGA